MTASGFKKPCDSVYQIALQFIDILKIFGFHSVTTVRTLFPATLRCLVAANMDIFIREHRQDFVQDCLEHFEGLVLAGAEVTCVSASLSVSCQTSQIRISGKNLAGMAWKLDFRNDVDVPCGCISDNLLDIGFGQIPS